MLYSLRSRANVKLSAAEARKVLTALRSAGWAPVGLESELAAARLIGIRPESIFKESARVTTYGPSEPGAGDVVVRDRSLYYFYAVDADEARHTRMVVMDDDDGPVVAEDILEVGVVSNDAGNLETRLEEFRCTVVDAAKNSIDGRRFRHLTFDWAPREANTGKLQALCQRLEKEGAQVRFETPTISEASVAAARDLLEYSRREILRDLSASGGFALEADIVRTRGEGSKGTLDLLVRSGLATRSQLIQCRQSSRPLTRINDPVVLQEGSGDLRCATCNRRFAEELMIPGYGISDLGLSLVRGNHWMTVWVTDELLRLGAEADSILWNLEESSEEIDIVLEFLGELWILELKDRDFDPRDAHSLNYRRVRYRPDKTFVITSGIVSSDARRVFEDVARETLERTRYYGGPRPNPVTPTYIEGLATVPSGLGTEFNRAARALAIRSIRPSALAVGISPARLVTAIAGT